MVTLDDCRDCDDHAAAHGDMIVCTFDNNATVRAVVRAARGREFVRDCPRERSLLDDQ